MWRCAVCCSPPILLTRGAKSFLLLPCGSMPSSHLIRWCMLVSAHAGLIEVEE